MGSDHEPLIPEAPRLSLPVLPRIVVGKWFWIGLGTLIAALMLAFTPLREWGPHDPSFGQGERLLNGMLQHPILWVTYLVPRLLLGYPSLWGASIALLWIAFARPSSPDRVLFAAATTGTVAAFAMMLNWLASFVTAVQVVSEPMAISFVGCASIALAAQGLRRVPRVVIQTLCVLAFLEALGGQLLADRIEPLAFLSGYPLPPLLCAVLLGLAVLAFGREFAEQCGAELFVFAPRDDDAEHSPIARISSIDFVAFGTAGILFTILIGWGIYAGQIHLPPHAGETGVDGWDIFGGFAFWEWIAVALMWYGFADTTAPRRSLFAAGVISGTLLFAPNVIVLFDVLSRQNGASVFGFPTSSATLVTAGGLALLLVARGAAPRWRGTFSWLCVAVIVLVIVACLVDGSNPVYVASGALLGASCFLIGVAIARHAGIDLFRTDDRAEETA